MELLGDVLISASRPRVWAALNDPEVLAACIPGCEGVEVVSPTEKTARVAVKVGPVRARFAGRIVMADVVEGERCAMSFEGSGGAAGMARGQSQVELSDEGEHTRLRYSVKASVAGKLGQVGGRMIDAAAKQMADQFFVAFQARIAPAPEAPGADGPEASAIASPNEAAATTTADAPGAARAASTAVAPSRAAQPSTEWLRVKWFVLGSLATAFGIWVGSRL